MRPRRQVIEVEGVGFTVTESDFTTTDATLAAATRDELDRVDPLPCPHAEGVLEIRTFSSPWPYYLCCDCGHRFEHDDPFIIGR